MLCFALFQFAPRQRNPVRHAIGDDVVVEGAYSLNFAGGGSLSLKEALDAAHGHEHNEDGSEITPEQRKEEEGNQGSPVHAPPSRLSKGLQVYSIAITLVAMVLFQQLWSRRRDSGSETTC